MPGCAAVSCSNSAKKGYLMKSFPKDSERRKQWLINMKRRNWTPTDHSRLCEIHFIPEMWEKTRIDGSRKLKLSAVPTIFSFSHSNKLRTLPAPKNLTAKKIEFSSGESTAVETMICSPDAVSMNIQNPSHEHNMSVNQSSATSQSTSSEKSNAVLVNHDTRDVIVRLVIQNPSHEHNISVSQSSATAQSTSSEKSNAVLVNHDTRDVIQRLDIQNPSHEHNISVNQSSATSQSTSSEKSNAVLVNHDTRDVIERLDRYEKMFLKERNKVIKYKNLLRVTNKKLRKVEQINLVQPTSHPLLQQIFNNDQLTALWKKQNKKTTKFMKWSKQTITNSLKLKLSCGNNGYKELLKQGFPLPSIRTLERIQKLTI